MGADSKYTFCPACLLRGKIGVVDNQHVCSKCKESFKANDILISEDSVRMYIAQQNRQRSNMLLKELVRLTED